MRFGKTGRGLISLLCVFVLLVTTTPAWAVELGDQASATGENATAIGTNANAAGENATAIGTNALATGNNTMAIGSNASATAENSAALGAGSETGDRKNTVSVGAPGSERQITNVADGVAPTDAANVRQLDRVSLRLDRVGALAAAMSGLAPIAYNADEPTQAAIAAGMYSGKTAVAAGLFHYTKEDVMLNTAFALSGSERMGRLGVTVRFKKAKAKNVSVIPATPAIPAVATPATPAEAQTPAPVTVNPEVTATTSQTDELAIADNEVKG